MLKGVLALVGIVALLGFVFRWRRFRADERMVIRAHDYETRRLRTLGWAPERRHEVEDGR